MNITTKPLSYKEVSSIPRNGDHTTTIYIAKKLDELMEYGDDYNLVEEYSNGKWWPSNIATKPMTVQDNNIVIECRFEICEN